MRIAQVAPLYESVPPKLYGGTERVVSYLTEELVQQGHSVTLFASGDSQTQARLVSSCSRALRLDPGCVDRMAYHVLMLEQVFQSVTQGEFDIVHFHCDYLHFPLSRRHVQPQVTTLHGRLDTAELVPLYREFREMPVISISDSQRKPLPFLDWQRTVYHGLPPDLYRPSFHAGKYLAFVGRISPEKGLDRAIEIAKRAGLPLRIAAKVDQADMAYFQDTIRPLLGHPLIEFVGEIGEADKCEFFGNAVALLAPINWPEPFGLVMIEALACGTPVVAWKHGSVPELIDCECGFVVESVDQGVLAVKDIQRIKRRKCREVFLRRFTAARMARDYVMVYENLVRRMRSVAKSANGRRRCNLDKGKVLHPFDVFAG